MKRSIWGLAVRYDPSSMVTTSASFGVGVAVEVRLHRLV